MTTWEKTQKWTKELKEETRRLRAKDNAFRHAVWKIIESRYEKLHQDIDKGEPSYALGYQAALHEISTRIHEYRRDEIEGAGE